MILTARRLPLLGTCGSVFCLVGGGVEEGEKGLQ
jgi:hypothetical protein